MHFASHLRTERLGEFTVGTSLRRSEALAITQVLVLYQLVTARAAVAVGAEDARADRPRTINPTPDPAAFTKHVNSSTAGRTGPDRGPKHEPRARRRSVAQAKLAQPSGLELGLDGRPATGAKSRARRARPA